MNSRAALEDFQDLLVAQERAEEPRESLEEVRRQLIEAGKLAGRETENHQQSVDIKKHSG